MALRKPPEDDVVRITTARVSPEDDLATRQRRYVISMAVRVVCFVGAVAVGPGWLRWVLMAAAVFLPYVAVVIANASDRRRDDFHLDAVSPTHQLPSGSDVQQVHARPDQES